VDERVRRPYRASEGLLAECVTQDRDGAMRKPVLGAGPHEGAHHVPAGEQARDERSAEIAGCAGDEDVS
jgi:hypothetical protein